MIAFGHKSRVGKDLSADYLIEKYGGKKLSFASPIYEIQYCIQTLIEGKKPEELNTERLCGLMLNICRLNNSDRVAISGWIKTDLMSFLAENHPGRPGEKTPSLLILIGAGMRKVISPDIFVNRVISDVEWRRRFNQLICVSDVRFKNEASALRKIGFKLVKIVREDRPIDRDPTDISENDLNDYEFDFTIDNSGKKEHLYKLLDITLGDIIC
jgi:hypothetical protein